MTSVAFSSFARIAACSIDERRACLHACKAT